MLAGCRVCFSTLAFACALTAAGPARADSPLLFEAERCDALDMVELERLLQLELEGELGDERVRVRLKCVPSGVQVDADKADGRALHRMLALPASEEPGRERLIAIATAQVVRALAWLPAPVAAAPAAAPADPHTPPSRQSPRKPPLPRARHGEQGSIAVNAGARVRDVDPRFLTWTAGLRGRMHVAGPWSLLLGSAFEGGGTERSAGFVRHRSARGELGVSHRLWESSHAAVDARWLASFGYFRLSGQPRAGYEGFDVDGLELESSLGVQPMLRASVLEFALYVDAGASLPNADALVEDDQRVTTRGVWLALGAALGVAF